MKHLLKLMDWSSKEIAEVLNLADRTSSFERENAGYDFLEIFHPYARFV